MWCIWHTFLYLPIGWASYWAGHIFLRGGSRDHKALAEATGSFKKMGFRSYCIYPEGVCGMVAGASVCVKGEE